VVGICGERGNNDLGFLRVLQFPLPTVPHSFLVLSVTLE
jgi:hypothetical protein